MYKGVSKAGPDIKLVTEYMTHGSLHDVVTNSYPKLSAVDCLKMLKDIACGVHCLHSQKPSLIHRDLTSLNVLVNEDLRCKIADFGLSKGKRDRGMTAQRGTLYENCVYY